MDNVEFYYSDLWSNDSLALEGENTDERYPESNTQSRYRGAPWISLSPSSTSIYSTGGSQLSIDSVIIIDHNLSDTATVSLYYSNDGWITETLEGFFSIYGKMAVYRCSNTLTKDNYKISIVDSGNIDGFVSIGKVWMGTKYTPKYGYKSCVIDTVFPDKKLESDNGQSRTIIKKEYSTFKMDFDLICDEEELDNMLLTARINEPLVFIKKPKGYLGYDYPLPAKYTYYATLTNTKKSDLAGSKIKFSADFKEER